MRDHASLPECSYFVEMFKHLAKQAQGPSQVVADLAREDDDDDDEEEAMPYKLFKRLAALLQKVDSYEAIEAGLWEMLLKYFFKRRDTAHEFVSVLHALFRLETEIERKGGSKRLIHLLKKTFLAACAKRGRLLERHKFKLLCYLTMDLPNLETGDCSIKDCTRIAEQAMSFCDDEVESRPSCPSERWDYLRIAFNKALAHIMEYKDDRSIVKFVRRTYPAIQNRSLFLPWLQLCYIAESKRKGLTKASFDPEEIWDIARDHEHLMHRKACESLMLYEPREIDVDNLIPNKKRKRSDVSGAGEAAKRFKSIQKRYCGQVLNQAVKNGDIS